VVGKITAEKGFTYASVDGLLGRERHLHLPS